MFKLYPFVSVNNQIFKSSEARILATSQGVLYGTGVFTTLKLQDGIPLFFEKHVDRLQRNAKQLGLETILTKELRESITKLIERNNDANCGMRITIVNNIPTPDVIITTFPAPENSINQSVISFEDTRDMFKTIKALSRPVNDYAMKQAIKNDATDALFVNNNLLIESTYAAIISMDHEGNLITPAIDGKGLDSITIATLSEQEKIRKTDIDITTEGPMILVSCLRNRSVTSLDKRKLRDAGKLLERVEALRKRAEDAYLQAAARLK